MLYEATELLKLTDSIENLLLLLRKSEDFQKIKEQLKTCNQDFQKHLHQLSHSKHQIIEIMPSNYHSLVLSIQTFLQSQADAFNQFIKIDQDYNSYRNAILKCYNAEARILQDSKQILAKSPTLQENGAIIDQFRTQKLLNLQNFPHLQLFEGTIYPWEALSRLPSYLEKLINSIPLNQRNKATIIGSVYVAEDVVIGEGTVVEHGAMIKGPAFIGRNCEIRKGAYLRGNIIVGDGSLIGNSCEVKGSIIFEKCQIPHFNYVGDSILDKRVHLAAGVITSNLKLDCTEVKVKFGRKSLKTNLLKFGAILGQHTQIGCNTVLNPGSIIGAESLVYPGAIFRGYLPSNHILKVQQKQQMVKIKK